MPLRREEHLGRALWPKQHQFPRLHPQAIADSRIARPTTWPSCAPNATRIPISCRRRRAVCANDSVDPNRSEKCRCRSSDEEQRRKEAFPCGGRAHDRIHRANLSDAQHRIVVPNCLPDGSGERQAGPSGVTERSEVPVRSGNADGGKGPQLRGNTRKRHCTMCWA